MRRHGGHGEFRNMCVPRHQPADAAQTEARAKPVDQMRQFPVMRISGAIRRGKSGLRRIATFAHQRGQPDDVVAKARIAGVAQRREPVLEQAAYARGIAQRLRVGDVRREQQRASTEAGLQAWLAAGFHGTIVAEGYGPVVTGVNMTAEKRVAVSGALTGKTLVVTGNGDVLEPEAGIAAIGSGGNFALAAARALVQHSTLDARAIVEQAMGIAADICVYTNHTITVESLS